MLKKLIIIFAVLITYHSHAQICPGEAGSITWECWQNLPEDEIGELSALVAYTKHPNFTFTKYNTRSQQNFDNYYGSRLRGFITVPSTETVIFNITGNDKVQFYLSTDQTEANKQLLAYTNDYTNAEEHDKYETQTSDSITLQANQFYYFEILHVEGTGSDHVTLWWKTHLVDINQWNYITAAYLTNIGCQEEACAPMGTPCDDGNPSTTEDREDGNCQCFGTPAITNDCIGEQGLITRYRYDSIPGGDLNDLYESAKFPAMPDFSENVSDLGVDRTGMDDIGSLLQGYLTVPVSGNYKFNITGDDETIFFISSNDDPANKQAHMVFVSGWTYPVEHDKYIWQSTSNIYLEAGQYYYIEINQKQGGGSEHFNAFWQTPYTESGVWKRIPEVYFYAYDCTLACIDEGTPCDDGDPFTNNDQYNENCDCIGTPCSGPDCDSPLANYVPYDKCKTTDQLDNRPENNWLSCEKTSNPNPAYGESHWIQYDLGERYFILGSHIWNYNVDNKVESGISHASIDYSLDGINWTHLGSYDWPLASGSGSYSGFIGPDFQGVEAQYVLITSLDTEAMCQGLGKVAFSAILCPFEGTVCDDGNPETVNDQYNNNCECVGTDFFTNDCEDEIVALGDSTLFNSKHSAVQTVSSVSQIAAQNKVSFVGGDYILLDVGFETGPEAIFIANIDTCDAEGNRLPASTIAQAIEEAREKAEQMKLKKFDVIQKNEKVFEVIYFIDEPGITELVLTHATNGKTYPLFTHEYKNKGVYRKLFPTKKIEPGSYVVSLKSKSDVRQKRITVNALN